MADKPNITREGYVAQLVRTGIWATPQNPIQYAFLAQKPAYLPNEPGFAVFSAAQRAAVERAFAMIAEVVNLTFVQVLDNQQIPGPGNPRIAFYANTVELSYSGSMYAHRVEGSAQIYGADIRFNNARIAQRQSNEGWWDFTSFVALHEVLHAMGLSHPGDYNGQGPTYQNNAEFVEDTVQYSVMSYFGAANTGADHTLGSVLYGGRTPLLYDILALQNLYAPNMATRAGDTVYGFNSNTGANSPFNFAVTAGPVVAIWDGGGIDTIDLSGYSGGSLIDLNEGAFSDAGGLTKNIAIAFNVTIENAVGGTGQDRLIGNASANRLDGGAGADLMEGGPGDDLYIVDDPGDVVVELAGAGRDEVRTALAAYVLPANVEALTGTSAAAQSLTGNDLANSITGGAGDDTLYGGAGDDALEGGAGNDDTAVYLGNRGDYEIGTVGQVTVRDVNGAHGDEGTDSLNGIENVRFADMVVRLGIDPNNEPELGDPDMVDQAWLDGVAASYTIPATSFIDIDGQHTLSFQATLAGGAPLPSWLSFDSATRTFSGTPPLQQVGAPLTVRVTASDGKQSVFDDFEIVVSQSRGANVWGTTGADVLDGTFREEILYGDEGDDILRGSAGADRLDGHAGTDTADYSASPQGVVVDLITSSGTAGHADGDEFLSIERVTGSAFADIILGGADQNLFDGGAGADRLEGGQGDDTYVVDDSGDLVVEAAGEGTDLVRTALASYSLAANVERLTGTASTGQVLSGNGLANVITGGSGDDLINPGAGIDTMAGGLGNDTYVVEQVGDLVVEAPNAGLDRTDSGLGAYTLTDNVEILVGRLDSGQILTGNGLANLIQGRAGDDVIDGGLGADNMQGGLGNDLYFVDNGADNVTEDGSAGTDEVRTALAAYTLAANVETLTGTSAIGQSLTGNALANTLTGDGGDDILDGGADSDQLAGGPGNDTYFVDAGDTASEAASAGTDEVRTALTAYTLGTNLENLVGTSLSGQSLTGNGAANIITGGVGNDVIDGAAGADQLHGGLGDDLYLVDGGDTVSEASDSGSDEVRTGLAAYVLATNVEKLTGTSASGQALTGNGLANLLTGGGGNDTIDGGAGADHLAGGLGNDIYLVDSGDAVVEAANGGTDEVRTSLAAYVLAENVERLFGTSASGQTLTGNELDNLISAGSGNDTLDGGSGADQLAGGIGNDLYILDSGDSVSEAANAGSDEVRTALASYTLGANLENLTGSSAAGQSLVGNELDNRIIGNAGADLLDGLGGTDRLEGLAGDDRYVVDGAGDLVIETTGQGYDTLFSTVSYILAAGTEVEAMSTMDRAGTQAIDFTGNEFANALSGNGGANHLSGGGGDDRLDGGAGDDRLDGGEGIDTATYSDAGSAVAVSLALPGTAQNTGGAGIDTLVDIERLIGSAYGDTLIGNGFANILDGLGGADTMRGGDGNDTYVVDDTGDVVEELAGEGVDTVLTSLAAYSLVGTQIEKLGSASDSAHDFRGNAGDNVITGRAGSEFIRLQDGGVDTASGGGGNDVFLFGATLTAADAVDGGSGVDQIAIQGNYALTLGSGIVGVESIAILPGSDTRFGDPGTNSYDYHLTTLDVNVAAGVQMIVDASGLRVGEDLAFDGSLETNGSFFIYGGRGVDALTGGAGNDAFYFGEGLQFGAGDVVNGGPGGIDQLGLRGSYSVVFGAGQLIGIENIGLVSAQDTRFGPQGASYNYNLTMNDGNVAAGTQLTLDAFALRGGETLSFDGSAETNGTYRIFGGQGHDHIVTGAGNDTLAGNRGADNLTGGGGADTFRFNSTADSSPEARDHIHDFAPGVDKIDLTRIDADTHTAGDQAFHWVDAFTGSGAGSAGELRAYLDNGNWFIEGDTDGNGVADLRVSMTAPAMPIGQGDFLL